MDSRKLTLVLLLMVAVTAGFVTAPVFSGEHPWDSDRTGGTLGGGGGRNRTTNTDTTIVRDTTIVANAAASGTGSTDVWVNILTAAWSVSLTL
jgi:hypothetical protein